MGAGGRIGKAAAISFVVAIAVLLAGCALSPGPADKLAALSSWSGGATLFKDGTVVGATYEGWPVDEVPIAYACLATPTRVFAEAPSSEVVIDDDPSCAPFAVELEGHTLRISIDRATLPPAFQGLDVFTRVLAVAYPEGSWEITSPMPLNFPGARPS